MDRVRLPWWVIAADLLVAVTFVIGAIALMTDDLVITIAGERFSSRSATRPFAWAIGLALVRFYFCRLPPWGLDRLTQLQPALTFEESRIFAPMPVGAWPRIRELTLLTLSYAVLVAIATWPIAVQPYSVSDMGDPLFSIWRLTWITHEFPQNPLNIFNGNQMYPEPRTLTFSDPVLAPTLLFAPLHALGLHRIVAYNIVLLAGWVFSGVTMFVLVRALTGRADAAWVAGAIFAVHPYRGEHLAHLELQMTIWLPIALLYLHRTMASGKLRDGLAFGVAAAAQFYTALYYGAFLMTYATVVGGVLWFARGRPWKPIRALAAGAVLGAILFAPVASAYLKTRSHLGDRHVGEVTYYSAVGTDYQKAHYRSWTYRDQAEGAEPERSLFPRLTPVILMLLAVWPPISVTRIAYLLALAFSVETSLGMNGSIFPWLYEYVPPYGGIRVPARYSIMAGLSLAILAGFGAARLFRRWPRARTPLMAALVAAIAIEALPGIELVKPWREPSPVYASLIGAPPTVIAEFPTPDEGVYQFSEFAYLYFSTFHWHKLLNGQSGMLPPSYDAFVDQGASFPSDETLKLLRARGVEYVTIHGAFYPAHRLQNVLDQVDARTDMELVTAVRWEGSESRLYRLRRPPRQ
ncbi:MAG TPA: hypothetical protein VGD94_08515 [Vicinamibacterales bacterium]